MRRTIIVGDVHGCFVELQLLLTRAEYDARQDRLIFVGDVVNRGPNSRRVLEWIGSLGAEAVVGNHELGFLEALASGTDDPDFAELRMQLGTSLSEWSDWMAGLPPFIETDNYIVVHAGLAPGRAPAETETRLLANIRTWDGSGKNLDIAANPPWYQLYNGKKLVVYGHWAKQGLTIRHNVIGLDSGCVYGRSLTAIELPTCRIFQVPAAMEYVAVSKPF